MLIGRAASDHDLSIILPAFNEERRLPETLARLTQVLEDRDIDYRLLVTDDGSDDGTAEISNRFGWRCSTWRLPRHTGKGAAVRAGMLRGSGRVLAFTDADLPYELDALCVAYEWIRADRCDAVFGSRNLATSQCHVRRRRVRRIATVIYRTFVGSILAPGLGDVQCGLKVFSHRAARAIFSRASIDGLAFDAEIVLLSDALRLRRRTLPVMWIRDEASGLSPWRHALPMFVDLWRLRLKQGRDPRRRSLEQIGPAA